VRHRKSRWGWIMVVVAAGVMVAAAAASAAEMHMLCVGAMRSTMPGLVETFKQRTGNSVTITFGTAGTIKAKGDSGEPADVIVLTPGGLKELSGKGLVPSSSIVDLVQVGVGVAIPKGAPAPDISTPDAFKRSLMAAHTIYFGDPKTASSAIYFVKVLDRLGISKEILAKSETYSDGQETMEHLAKGHGIGITQTTEILPNPNVQLVGPLPGDLQNLTTYTAALLSRSTHPREAEALLKFLTGSEAKSTFKAAGFEVKP